MAPSTRRRSTRKELDESPVKQVPPSTGKRVLRSQSQGTQNEVTPARRPRTRKANEAVTPAIIPDLNVDSVSPKKRKAGRPRKSLDEQPTEDTIVVVSPSKSPTKRKSSTKIESPVKPRRTSSRLSLPVKQSDQEKPQDNSPKKSVEKQLESSDSEHIVNTPEAPYLQEVGYSEGLWDSPTLDEYCQEAVETVTIEYEELVSDQAGAELCQQAVDESIVEQDTSLTYVRQTTEPTDRMLVAESLIETQHIEFESFHGGQISTPETKPGPAIVQDDEPFVAPKAIDPLLVDGAETTTTQNSPISRPPITPSGINDSFNGMEFDETLSYGEHLFGEMKGDLAVDSRLMSSPPVISADPEATAVPVKYNGSPALLRPSKRSFLEYTRRIEKYESLRNVFGIGHIPRVPSSLAFNRRAYSDASSDAASEGDHTEVPEVSRTADLASSPILRRHSLAHSESDSDDQFMDTIESLDMLLDNGTDMFQGKSISPTTPVLKSNEGSELRSPTPRAQRSVEQEEVFVSVETPAQLLQQDDSDISEFLSDSVIQWEKELRRRETYWTASVHNTPTSTPKLSASPMMPATLSSSIKTSPIKSPILVKAPDTVDLVARSPNSMGSPTRLEPTTPSKSKSPVSPAKSPSPSKLRSPRRLFAFMKSLSPIKSSPLRTVTLAELEAPDDVVEEGLSETMTSDTSYGSTAFEIGKIVDGIVDACLETTCGQVSEHESEDLAITSVTEPLSAASEMQVQITEDQAEIAVVEEASQLLDETKEPMSDAALSSEAAQAVPEEVNEVRDTVVTAEVNEVTEKPDLDSEQEVYYDCLLPETSVISNTAADAVETGEGKMQDVEPSDVTVTASESHTTEEASTSDIDYTTVLPWHISLDRWAQLNKREKAPESALKAVAAPVEPEHPKGDDLSSSFVEPVSPAPRPKRRTHVSTPARKTRNLKRKSEDPSGSNTSIPVPSRVPDATPKPVRSTRSRAIPQRASTATATSTLPPLSKLAESNSRLNAGYENNVIPQYQYKRGKRPESPPPEKRKKQKLESPLKRERRIRFADQLVAVCEQAPPKRSRRKEQRALAPIIKPPSYPIDEFGNAAIAPPEPVQRETIRVLHRVYLGSNEEEAPERYTPKVKLMFN